MRISKDSLLSSTGSDHVLYFGKHSPFAAGSWGKCCQLSGTRHSWGSSAGAQGVLICSGGRTHGRKSSRRGRSKLTYTPDTPHRPRPGHPAPPRLVFAWHPSPLLARAVLHASESHVRWRAPAGLEAGYCGYPSRGLAPFRHSRMHPRRAVACLYR